MTGTPRLRGENYAQQLFDADQAGTPPPTRGKSNISFYDQHQIRNTPAYAGKIQNGTHVRFRSQEHPRLRGENTIQTPTQSSAPGTPPPTRGKSVAVSWSY